MSIPLLLTATTNPGETINVTVNSVDDRCQQYLDTLEFYLGIGVFKKIIFYFVAIFFYTWPNASTGYYTQLTMPTK